MKRAGGNQAGPNQSTNQHPRFMNPIHNQRPTTSQVRHQQINLHSGPQNVVHGSVLQSQQQQQMQQVQQNIQPSIHHQNQVISTKPTVIQNQNQQNLTIQSPTHQYHGNFQAGQPGQQPGNIINNRGYSIQSQHQSPLNRNIPVLPNQQIVTNPPQNFQSGRPGVTQQYQSVPTTPTKNVQNLVFTQSGTSNQNVQQTNLRNVQSEKILNNVSFDQDNSRRLSSQNPRFGNVSPLQTNMNSKPSSQNDSLQQISNIENQNVSFQQQSNNQNASINNQQSNTSIRDIVNDQKLSSKAVSQNNSISPKTDNSVKSGTSSIKKWPHLEKRQDDANDPNENQSFVKQGLSIPNNNDNISPSHSSKQDTVIYHRDQLSQNIFSPAPSQNTSVLYIPNLFSVYV